MKRLTGIRIQQRDSTDCGAACIASIAAWYGMGVSVAHIRQCADTDMRGTSVAGIIQAFGLIGFRAKATRADSSNFINLPLPLVAHVVLPNGSHHYVAVYKVTRTHVLVMDPTDGSLNKRRIRRFISEWSGVVIMVLLTEEAQAAKMYEQNTGKLWRLVKPHTKQLTLAFLASIVYTALVVMASIYLQRSINSALNDPNAGLLNLLGYYIILITVFQLFIAVAKQHIILGIGRKIDEQLVSGYYRHVLNLPKRFFDTMKVGEIASRINDAVRIRTFVNEMLVELAVSTFGVITSLFVLFYYCWQLALIVVGFVPVYYLVYSIVNKFNAKWQRSILDKSALLQSQVIETFDCIGTIKRFGLQDFMAEKINGFLEPLFKHLYQNAMRSVYAANVIELITRLLTISVIWIGGHAVIMNQLTSTELLSFYAIVIYFSVPVTTLIGSNKDLQAARISKDRLFEIFDLATERIGVCETGEGLFPKGDICFNDVHYSHFKQATLFQGLNMKIVHGSSTAIIGESGSGKSTLMDLLQNLYPLKSGEISIGGIAISSINRNCLRSGIAIVSQQTDLFSVSIIDNICIGTVNPEMEHLYFICRMLGLHEVIMQMPSGYHTILQEQGNNLSGGERQRLSVARALYRKPSILILDEATSSIDIFSEMKVQEAVSWFKEQGKTVIMIAHRLTTTRYCDNIIVLNKGTMLESGTHESLLKLNGHYEKMWRSYASIID